MADAIERGDFGELREELGDLLLQVVFHAQMADEAGLFDFRDVARGIGEKLVRRHPHVFGDADIGTADAQLDHWEQSKARERRDKGVDSLMDGVPRGLPELLRAEKLQKRAAEAGFDWPHAHPVLEKFDEELLEIREAIDLGDRAHIEDELGDLMFNAVNLARKLKIDAGRALRHANAKFEERFRAMERAAGSHEGLAEMNLDDQEALWQRVKRDNGGER